MKNLKIARLLVAGFLIAILSACTKGETSDVTFSTNRVYENRSVICDNATTELNYSFTYTPGLLGALKSWEQKLVGKKTGNVRFARTYLPSDDQVIGEGLTYRVKTTIPAKTAPLSLDTQAIIVEPKVLGQARLELVLEGTDGTTEKFVSRYVDVMNCKEN